MICLLTASMCEEPIRESVPETNDPTASQTVLLYMMGENSLSSFIHNDVAELVKGMNGHLPEKANMVVFIDDRSTPRLLHYKKEKQTLRCDTIMAYTEELCSTDPVVLSDILRETYQNCPAKEYGIILWSHGEGWLPYVSNKTKANYPISEQSIGIDNGMNSGSNIGPQMNINDLRRVLEEFENIRFVMFDACFMQSIEVAYELKNSCDYLISSPMEIPGPGAPYHELIAPMFKNGRIDVNGIAYAYYDYYRKQIENGNSTYGAALSVIKCNELEKFSEYTAQLIPQYIRKEEGDIPLDSIFAYDFRQVPLYYDLADLIRHIAPQDKYLQWENQLKRTVPYAYTTSLVYSYYGGNIRMNAEKFSGISTYIPKNRNGYQNINAYFQQTSWYEAAGWDKTGW